ncbi:hypothetical protein F4678DRAFT_460254 [Xylaria arbuscula]|nr:hypothetical protein F4678DRAFT_460254 [Xylaria arbuscula]
MVIAANNSRNFLPPREREERGSAHWLAAAAVRSIAAKCSIQQATQAKTNQDQPPTTHPALLFLVLVNGQWGYDGLPIVAFVDARQIRLLHAPASLFFIVVSQLLVSFRPLDA